MIASLRIAKNPDVRPKKKSWSTPFSIQFFSPEDTRGPAPSDCGGTAATRRSPDPRGTSQQIATPRSNTYISTATLTRPALNTISKRWCGVRWSPKSGVMGRKRPAASQMMPTDELDGPMELGADAAAPAASTRARHTLSGDDGTEEPSPTRRCLGGLEVGCPLALLKHNVEILQALATAASNAPDVRVP